MAMVKKWIQGAEIGVDDSTGAQLVTVDESTPLPVQDLGLNLGAASSIDATGSSVVAGSATTYIFSEEVRRAEVIHHPDSVGLLYVKWNTGGASRTNWDDVIVPNGKAVAPASLRVTSVSIFSESDQELGTNFRVKGYV